MDNKPESHSSRSDEAKKNEELQPQSELARSEKTDVPTGVATLRALLNKTLRIEMSDGRVLVGVFLCTDADANVILGSCSEYLPHESRPLKANEEPRMLGLIMVPGKHIVSVCKDLNEVHSDSTKTRDSNSEGVV